VRQFGITSAARSSERQIFGAPGLRECRHGGLADRTVGVRFGRAEGQLPLFDQNVTGVTDVPSVCGYNQAQRVANRLGWELEMSERRITHLFGLGLGAIITCTMVLNAFAF
jgi:hypothetical protein